MYARLILRSGRHSGRKLTMQRRKILLGSDKDCALRIRGQGVAAHHCALFVSNGALAIHHLARHGKTYVGDESVHGTRRLQPGDLVRIGPISFEVQFDPDELARATAPPVPQEDELERRPSEDRIESPEPAARIVGVCKSKQWAASASPSDAAAGVLRKLSHRE